MKATLFATFVALLNVGCGGPDLDDKETLDKIIAEAIDGNTLQERGKEGEKLAYAPNQQTPYTGWVKEMYDNGQIMVLAQIKGGKKDGLSTLWHKNGQKKAEVNFKDCKLDGPLTWWYENGQNKAEGTFKDHKLMSIVVWKPNGEKCHVTKVVNGNGGGVRYNEDGTEKGRFTYKDGKLVID